MFPFQNVFQERKREHDICILFIQNSIQLHNSMSAILHEFYFYRSFTISKVGFDIIYWAPILKYILWKSWEYLGLRVWQIAKFWKAAYVESIKHLEKLVSNLYQTIFIVLQDYLQSNIVQVQG